jgi:hypothetical protein
LLALRAPRGLTVTIQHPTTDPLGQLTAIDRPEKLPDRGQDLRLILGGT